MYCKKCGKELKEGVSFCGNCGQSVTEDLSGSESKRKKPIIGVVIFILLLLVIVLAVALVLSLRSGDKTIGNNIESEVIDTTENDIHDAPEAGITDEIVTTPENNGEGDIANAPEGGAADGENDSESEQSTQTPDIALEKVIDPERLAALEESMEAYREYINNYANDFKNVLGYRLIYIAGSDYPLCFLAKMQFAGASDVEIYCLSYTPTTSMVRYSDQVGYLFSDRIFDSADVGVVLTISYNEQTEYLQAHLYSYFLGAAGNGSYPAEYNFYQVYKYSADNGTLEQVFDGKGINYSAGIIYDPVKYDITIPVSGNNITEKQFNDYLNAYGVYTDSFTWEDMYGTLDEAIEAVTAP